MKQVPIAMLLEVKRIPIARLWKLIFQKMSMGSIRLIVILLITAGD